MGGENYSSPALLPLVSRCTENNNVRILPVAVSGVLVFLVSFLPWWAVRELSAW